MKGYFYVEEEAYDQDEILDYWVDECLKWNPFAKSSKKKT